MASKNGSKLSGTNPNMGPSKDDEKRIIGLGWDPSKDQSPDAMSSDIVQMFKKALSCGDPNYLPIIAKVEWEFDGAMSETAVQNTLGDQIDQLASGTTVDGVAKVYSTPGLINGEFQTYNLAIAVGSHFRISTQSFEVPGNAFKRGTSDSVGGISANDWTKNDLANGALGVTWDGSPDTQPVFPARLQYNWWLACAFAAAIKAMNFRWSYGALVNIFEDQLANTAFLQFMTQDGASGTSQIDVTDVVQRCNAYYQELGSSFDFRPYNANRLGSEGVGGPGTPNLGVFSGFNGDIVDVAYGAGGLRALFGECCSNAPFRMLRKAYLLQPGVPPGLFYEASNNDQMALFRRYMSASFGQAGGAVPPILTDAGKVTPGFAPDIAAFPNAGLEPLITPAGSYIAQQRYNGKMPYKYSDGGFWSTSILGFEISRTVARAIENHPQIADEIKRSCGCELGWTD